MASRPILLRLLLVTLAAACGSAEAAPPNSWRTGPSLLGARHGAVIATLGDGRVLVVGGRHVTHRYETPATPTSEIYDPWVRRWTSADSLRRLTHHSIAMTALTDGGALAVGKGDGRELPYGATGAARFDPSSNTWTPVAPPPDASDYLGNGLVQIPNGRVLLVVDGARDRVPVYSIYDVASDTWTPAARTSGASKPLVPLSDGRVVGLGGVPGVFYPATGAWSQIAPPPSGRGPILAGASLATDEVVAVREGHLSVYDPARDLWSATTLAAGFDTSVLVTLRDGRVFATDGARAWVFDPQSRRLYRTFSPPRVRGYAAVTSLGDGRVLLAGGIEACDGSVDECQIVGSRSVADVQLFQPPPPRPTVSRVAVTSSNRVRILEFDLDERATVSLALARRARGRWRAARSYRARMLDAGRKRIRLDLRAQPSGRYRITISSRDLFDRVGRLVRIEFRLATPTA